jgi:hypothetical protein
MFQKYLLNDPRYHRVDDIKDLSAMIEEYVAELGSTQTRGKLVRVLVTVADLDGERSWLKPELALILDLRSPHAPEPEPTA